VPPVPPTKPSILLLALDPVERTAIRRALESQGFQVRESAGGLTLALVFFAEVPEVLITDVDAADPREIETVRLLRLGFPRIPIIGCCRAAEARQSTEAIRRLGLFAMFVKPVAVSDLIIAVHAALTHGLAAFASTETPVHERWARP